MEKTNREKWIEALRGKNHYEAFKLIWSPKRNLTGKQRQSLVRLHRQLTDKNTQKTRKEALNTRWWQDDEKNE